MVRCPRCGGAADQLHPLPRAAIPDDARGGEAVDGDLVACSWCLHEITEG